MNKSSPKLIGAFVLGAVALLVGVVFVFGAGSFFQQGRIAVSYFKGSIAGLSVGAPVTFRGVPIGNVTDIQIRIDRRTLDARIPIFYELDESRITWVGNPSISVKNRLDDAIRHGLRAQLVQQNLVTAQLAVQLVVVPAKRIHVAHTVSEATEIPSIPSEFEALKNKFEMLRLADLVTSATSAIQRLNSLLASNQTGDVLATLNRTLHELHGLTAEVHTRLPPLFTDIQQTSHAAERALEAGTETLRSLNDEAAPLADRLQATLATADETLKQARITLASTNNLLAEDKPTYDNLQSTLREVEAAARSIRSLADTVERNPTMFLRGR